MRPKIEETYNRDGVYARITGKRQFEVRPNCSETKTYWLTGPEGFQLEYPGYYEAVQAGLKLASVDKPANSI
jgi:hypothetical protein